MSTVNKVALFWMFIAILSVYLSRPAVFLLGIFSMLIIAGFGTVFTLLLINDVFIPLRRMRINLEKTEDIINLYSVFIFKTAGMFLIVIGGASFINGFLCAVGVSPWITEKTEIPLTDVGTYITDKNGNLYCSLNFYSRIQSYDKDGHFLTGWFINSGGGRMSMKIDEKNRLLVANYKGHTLHTFSSDGRVVDEKKIEGDYSEFKKWDCEDEKGKEIIAIIQDRVPIYCWFLFGPQCFFVIFVGLIIAGASEKILQKKGKAK